MRNPELWERLREFRVDDGNPVLPFTARLARENGWSPNFAQRVFSEYRRFLYLAAVAGHVVTPSDHVDQAWHLHLAYTRSYWDTLCRSILNRPLHHDPTRGGESESSRFESCYERTLRSYEVEFGEAPPADIWPGPRDRFDHDAHARRVNTLDHWVIPKRTTTHAALVGALAVAAITIAGCVGRTGTLTSTPFYVVAFGIALIAVVVGIYQRIKHGPSPRDGSGGSGCSGCATHSGCGGDGDGGSGCGGGGCGGGD